VTAFLNWRVRVKRTRQPEDWTSPSCTWLPWLGVEETNVVPAGMASLTETLLAGARPAFVSTIV
jgi:hypothetical protein